MREGDGEPSSESMQGEGRVQIWFSVRPSVRSQSHARTHAITRLARASERAIYTSLCTAGAGGRGHHRTLLLHTLFLFLASFSFEYHRRRASERDRSDADGRISWGGRQKSGGGRGGMLPNASFNMRLKCTRTFDTVHMVRCRCHINP